ncbi:hypothetical protein [Solwaraspora sp. WMMD792]|uniref:hypothetical protein n=1 Tax=Solwaraspora sp. WMMD792 TaxID=3016099 RepID=UPI002416FAD7|nr:hypothetical protein [Solwaraspora sp. WMMD792]MDG4769336.1 hypothetical protein [Solwaraspora sp. WMMD792]
MVRIPSLSRRTEPTRPADNPPPTGATTATATGTADAAEADTTRADRTRADTTRADTTRADTTRGGTRAGVTDPATRPTPPGPRPEPPTREGSDPRPAPPPAPAGPRPRASLLATVSLITGVTGALFVLSGPLAPYGIAIGVIALATGLGGISATARRHIAGRTEALMGIVLALGTMIIGSLALTGALSWLTTETDMVQQVRQWLDSQFVGIF